MRGERDQVTKRPLTFAGLFAVALLAALNITVFGSAAIYLPNSDEFSVGFLPLVCVLAGLGLVIAVVLAGFGLLLKRALRTYYVSILLALGFLLWVQGAFLMHDYGVLDARGINWEGISVPIWLDGLIWVAVLVVAVLYARAIARVAVFASLVLVFLQLSVLSVAAINLDRTAWFKQVRTASGPPDSILEYSDKGDIVHVVMDNFQTDVFEEIIEEEGLSEHFDGFVLFRENMTVSPHTVLAVPAIFSGNVYDGSTSPEVYYREAMEQGFQNALLESDYTVNLIPLMSMAQSGYSNYYTPPVIFRGSYRDRLKKDVLNLLDLSLFRQLPHRARIWIYNQNNWRLSLWLSDPDFVKAVQQRRFLADYIDRIDIAEGDSRYHFLHFWPPHPPFTTTESGRYAGRVLENTRENYINEARPVVQLLVEFIDKLKSLGIYDNTMIIFQSDHGGGFEPAHMPRRLSGLLAIKPVNGRGPMSVSNAPTSIADIAQTIMAEAGLQDAGFPGESILEMGDEARVRQFVYMGKMESRIAHRVVVDGSIYSAESFSQAEIVSISIEPNDYRYNERINMGMTGKGGRYLGSGWAAQSDRHCWTNGIQAELILNVEPPEADLRLMLEFTPHVHPETLPEQRVNIMVNGQLAIAWVGRERARQRLEATIPREWIDSDEVTISFSLPDAKSPFELGTGGDRRKLGIALINFKLQTLDAENEI
jgi:hypothetical protein